MPKVKPTKPVIEQLAAKHKEVRELIRELELAKEDRAYADESRVKVERHHKSALEKNSRQAKALEIAQSQIRELQRKFQDAQREHVKTETEITGALDGLIADFEDRARILVETDRAYYEGHDATLQSVALAYRVCASRVREAKQKFPHRARIQVQFNHGRWEPNVTGV